MANRVALTAVARIADETQVRLPRDAAFYQFCRAVARSVVHHQHLRIAERAAIQPRQNYIEGGGQTALFIKCGDDDGERQRSIIAAHRLLALTIVSP